MITETEVSSQFNDLQIRKQFVVRFFDEKFYCETIHFIDPGSYFLENFGLSSINSGYLETTNIIKLEAYSEPERKPLFSFVHSKFYNHTVINYTSNDVLLSHIIERSRL